MLNRSGSVIYVGNLPDDIREREIDDLFHKASIAATMDQYSWDGTCVFTVSRVRTDLACRE